MNPSTRTRLPKRCATLLVVLAVALLTAPVSASAGLDDGLVAHYRLDGDATDSSGNGNDGAVVGATAAPDRFGDPSRALSFDGVDDLVEIPDSPDFDMNQPVTVSAWIQVDDNSSGGLVSHWGWGGLSGDAFVVRIDATRLEALFVDPSVVTVTDPSPVPTGIWRFVAMTYDGTTVHLYQDGVPSHSALVAASSILSDQPVVIGFEEVANGQPHHFDGTIDDVRIYDRALDPSEIFALFNIVIFTDGFETADTTRWSTTVSDE